MSGVFFVPRCKKLRINVATDTNPPFIKTSFYPDISVAPVGYVDDNSFFRIRQINYLKIKIFWTFYEYRMFVFNNYIFSMQYVFENIG